MSSTISQIVLISLFCGILSIIPQNLTSFSVLSATGITNTGSTTIYGDLGLSPGTSFTGFGPGNGVVIGVSQITNGVALNAQTNLIAFYSTIANLACGTSLTGVDLGSKTLAPGVYCFTSGATITGILSLDAQGQAAPIWVFQIASTLTLTSGSSVSFISGNFPCNVFWNVGTSVTLGSTSTLQGVVNAYQSISFGTGASATGKMLAQNGAVTFLANVVTNCTEAIQNTRTCFGRNATDPLVCSASGICVSNNTCTCNSNYIGNNCQSFTCYGKNATDLTVCGGQGSCNSPNNCTCNSQYGGNQCQSPICYTKLSTDSTVCGGQGTCSGPNNCTCNTNYIGAQCQTLVVVSCYGKLSNDSTVCGGQGTCASTNNCVCNSQYAGPQCQFPICSTRSSNNTMVCNGRGTCTAPNNCVCVTPFTGTDCQTSCSNDLTLFAVLAGTTITSTGATTITGDIGVSPGTTVSGFPPGLVSGNQFIGTTVSQTAQVSLIQRYLQISTIPCTTILTGQDLGGKTLFPGVYCFSAAAQLTGTLTLDTNNDMKAFWVFQISTSLTTSVNSKIVMTNGGSACNVFWNVGASASLAATSAFSGNINAYTSISLDTSAVVTGKLLAQNGAVTMISNTVTNCPITCATTCYGKSSNDTSVCGGKGTCSFPGYCVCQSGFNGTECQTSTRNTNASSTSAFSMLMFILSFLFMM